MTPTLWWLVLACGTDDPAAARDTDVLTPIVDTDALADSDPPLGTDPVGDSGQTGRTGDTGPGLPTGATGDTGDTAGGSTAATGETSAPTGDTGVCLPTPPFGCGPVTCGEGEYCFVAVPGIAPPTGDTGLWDNYSCLPLPEDCGCTPTCGCLDCGVGDTGGFTTSECVDLGGGALVCWVAYP